MTPEQFRAAGHDLVDRIAAFFAALHEQPVSRGVSPRAIRDLLGRDGLPTHGAELGSLLPEIATLIFEQSLHNGHPRFLGYITSSAAPAGALADLLAASVNPNLGLWDLSPVASEIEAQTVRWIAELIGFPDGCGGLMVSGGNMANLIGFITARRAMADWDVRSEGLYGDARRLTCYTSRETHTWIEKAADVSGMGTDAIRWIDTDRDRRMRVEVLAQQIVRDRREGHLPFLVVGTAGSVSTGAVDPLPEIAALCRGEQLWFHVDGAYGAPAAALPEAPAELTGLAGADSVALDPHKWLYSPIEAACTLVRDPRALKEAFSFLPSYYELPQDDGEPGINYYEYGIQNTRGFRALKVWLGLRQIGREGYVSLIREDIALARRLYEAAERHPELEACTHSLSIATFRYVPPGLDVGSAEGRDYLNALNQRLLVAQRAAGMAYLSNAVLGERYLLRACVVNFRTTDRDIDAVVEDVVSLGRRLDAEMRPGSTVAGVPDSD